jgi:hypothetical protein
MLTHILLALLLLTQTPAPAIGISVDNPFPNPGDTITITVCACKMPQDQTMSLYFAIDRPDGHNVQYRDLTFNDLPIEIPWTIPLDSPGGLYTVTVTWDHQYVETGFTVMGNPVPEVPYWAPMPILLCLLLATWVLTRRPQ